MAVHAVPRVKRNTFTNAWVITRREMIDSLRDWRILAPIIILTLIFPFLMDFTSRWATEWVSQFTSPLLVERINPFLLMIVGFFPISFSLIIALESFVGEKERNSIEPLLSMPVSDLELYLGKMMSSLLLPLLGSYLGISVFLLMRLLTSPSWFPEPNLLLIMVLLTTAKALVMVSGAVVVSSQTTSVRAANLLASFIIIPMALLLQAESVIMFYADYASLWWFILGLLVVNVILVRMGIRIFNREEILSKEMDELNFRTIGRNLMGYFLRPPELAFDRTNTEAAKFDILRFYRHDIPMLIRQQTLPLRVVLVVAGVSLVMGAVMATQYPFPPELLPLDEVTPEMFEEMGNNRILPTIDTQYIFMNNTRVLVLAALVAIFSFGSLTLLLTMINIGLVGFIIAQIAIMGYDAWLFTAVFILPHGIIELAALLLGLTFALRMGVAMISPPGGLDVGQGLMLTTANFVKVTVFLLAPLLLLAAFIEANLTFQLVLAVYGG